MRQPNWLRARPTHRASQALCAALCSALTLSACGGSHSTATHNPSPKAPQPTQPTSASATSDGNDPATIVLPSGAAGAHTILASVAGEAITAAEVRTLIQRKTLNAPLDPPQYTACTARLKREATSQASPEAKQLQGKSQAQLLKVCQGHYEDALRSALATAIHTRWLLGEAHKDNIHVSARAVAQEFQASKESFHSSSEFESYLKGSGQSVSLMKSEIKLGKLTDGLFAKASSNDRPATPSEVAAFYAQHKAGFAIPDGRRVLIVRTATQAPAQRAMSELRSGKSFAAVVKELSAIAQPITAVNGEVKDLKPNVYEEKPLNDAIFNAKHNRLYGPLKLTATHKTIASETNSGFFIFEVKATVAGHQIPLSQVKTAIARQLTALQQKRHLAAFVIAFRRRWTAKTDCRAGYVLVKSCKQFKQPASALAEDPYTI
jgi:foldase protein PrsA